MVRSEGDMSLKNPVTPPGIGPGTVRLVTQRLNHYATPGPYYCLVGSLSSSSFRSATSYLKKYRMTIQHCKAENKSFDNTFYNHSDALKLSSSYASFKDAVGSSDSFVSNDMMMSSCLERA